MFSYIELWFTDQNSTPLDIENKINMFLLIDLIIILLIEKKTYQWGYK